MYKREVIDEMNKLSTEVFGRKSKWRKMVEFGETEPVMEDTSRLTMVGKEQKVEKIKTQVMHVGPNGGEVPLFRRKRYTLDEAKDKMLEIKEQLDNFRAQIAKIQETQAKAKKDLDKASGTAAIST